MTQQADRFYLGKIFDSKNAKVTSDLLLYDPDDLTTHAVAVGMTGSGKTGLCIDLLEEAALQGIPAIMIDPKGDMTNALLHFPELKPVDFQPWVNPDQARKEDKTDEQAAADAAERRDEQVRQDEPRAARPRHQAQEEAGGQGQVRRRERQDGRDGRGGAGARAPRADGDDGALQRQGPGDHARLARRDRPGLGTGAAALAAAGGGSAGL